jgi:hypothetical protein
MSKNKSWFTLERIVILILLALLLLLQQCHKACPKEPWEVIKTTVKTYRDTVTQVKVDTVIRYVTLKVPVPVPAPEDTTLNMYTQEHSDSSLDATFITKVDGVLVNSDFKYKLKVPKEILTTITQVDTVTKYVKKAKHIIALGGMIQGSQFNNNFDAGMGISFYHKKGYLYQLNYLPLSKTVVIGFAYQLNRDYD